jgi:hypothetical protein
MNLHARKMDPAAEAGFEDAVAEFHTCADCKYVLQRAAL